MAKVNDKEYKGREFIDAIFEGRPNEWGDRERKQRNYFWKS